MNHICFVITLSQGFDGYLSDGHRQVTVNGQNINPWYWVVVHGNYKGSGVEEEHFQCALKAFSLASQYLQEGEETIKELFFAGFRLLLTYNSHLSAIRRECLEEVI